MDEYRRRGTIQSLGPPISSVIAHRDEVSAHSWRKMSGRGFCGEYHSLASRSCAALPPPSREEMALKRKAAAHNFFYTDLGVKKSPVLTPSRCRASWSRPYPDSCARLQSIGVAMSDESRDLQRDHRLAGGKRAIRRDVIDAINRSRAAANLSVASQAELTDILTEAMEAAWVEVVHKLGGVPSDPLPIWSMLAKRIMIAAGEGERDPQRLKCIALRALEA
jgi:hypothetical protein